jgi:hypothetical protein
MNKPPNHGTYQVWHEGKTHALDVESVGVREVWRLTKRPPDRWKDRPDVKVFTDTALRTRLGDVIVDPTCGAWEVQKDCFQVVEPPAPVRERMERDGIVPEYMQLLRGWTEDALARIDAHEKQYDPAASTRSANDNERGGPER